MQRTEAIELIQAGHFSKDDKPETWADLGCGSGMFSFALASLLTVGSVVIGIDKDTRLREEVVGGVSVSYQQADFENDQLKLPPLQGIMLANSLHYVKDPVGCLKRLTKYFHPGTCSFLIIEYDDPSANPWVPYPLPFKRIKDVLHESGCIDILGLGDIRSKFRRGNIYAVQAMIGISGYER